MIIQNFIKSVKFSYLSSEMEIIYVEIGKAFIHHYSTAEPSYGAD